MAVRLARGLQMEKPTRKMFSYGAWWTIGPQKTLNSQPISRKSKRRDITHPDVKLCYNAAVIETV